MAFRFTLSGLTDDAADASVNRMTKSNEQKVTQLELMLGMIENYCPSLHVAQLLTILNLLIVCGNQYGYILVFKQLEVAFWN